MADSRLVGLSIRTGSTIPNDGAVVSRRTGSRTNNRLAYLIIISFCIIADSYGLCTRSFSTLAYSHRGPISAVGIGGFSTVTDSHTAIRIVNFCLCTNGYAIRNNALRNVCTIAKNNGRPCIRIIFSCITHNDTTGTMPNISICTNSNIILSILTIGQNICIFTNGNARIPTLYFCLCTNCYSISRLLFFSLIRQS